MLLRYSSKDEREKNLGKFKAAKGVGGLLSSLWGSAMFAIGSFKAAFWSIGVGLIFLTPFMYSKLFKARDVFFAAG